MARIYESITPAQERFLLALMTAQTIADAARIANVADSTARHWLTRPDVRTAWLDMRRQAVDMALTAVQSATRQAVDTLLDCLKPKYGAGVRVRAAVAILETSLRAVEIGDLAVRVQQLEEALEDQQASERSQRGMQRYA